MKYILRMAVGVVFAFFFLVFLFVNAIKFDLLSAKFWARGFEESGFYQAITTEVDKLQAQIDRQAGRGKIRLAEVVTESRLREVVETNVERLVDYLNGKTEELAISLPVNDWGLPIEIQRGLPKLSWSSQMEIGSVLVEMGYPEKQSQEILKALSSVRSVSSSMMWIWLGLLLVTLALLAAHYSLGENKRDKISGSGVLLLGSGLLAALVGWGGDKVFQLSVGSGNWPVWAKMLVTGWITEFFSLGRTAGLLLVLIGLGLFVWVTFFGKKTKEKETKMKMGLAKKVIFTLLGVSLGVVLVIVLVGSLVTIFGGKVSFGVEVNQK